MNDIEIFKKLKKNYNTLKKDYNAGHYSVYEMQFEDFEAIENLIQRNKDLEQIEKEHKEENGRLREELENIEYIKRNFDYCLERKTKELEEDISEMYYKISNKIIKNFKGVVLDILQDELNISRDEAIEILENY